MRTVLVYLPPAASSYVPLGISALKAYLDAEGLGSELRVLDLNVETWNGLVSRDPSFVALAAFLRGSSGNFFDAAEYASHLHVRGRFRGLMDDIVRQAGAYLDSGDMGEPLSEILGLHAGSILSSDPETIGLSAMYPRQIVYGMALAKYLKEETGRGGRSPVRIVMGGAASSILLDPREVLPVAPFLDALFAGEGERVMKSILRGEPFERVPGAACRRPGGTVAVNSKPETISLKTIPKPDFSLTDLSMYLNPTPVLPIFVSRGCRWRRCRFCAHNLSFSGYRCKSVGQAVAEIEGYVREHGARHFYFTDQYLDTFFLDQLAAGILDRGIEINFHYMARPTADYTPAALDRLSKAGCSWISWGIESGSQRLLDIAEKGTYVDNIRRVICWAHEAGINNLLMMIFGLPRSTDEDLEQTSRLLEELAPFSDAMTASEFVLYGGTPFAGHPGQFGLIVTGREELCRVDGAPVPMNKLTFKEAGLDGVPRRPRGPLESEVWAGRKRWIWGDSLYDVLPAEHYLLYASRARGDGMLRGGGPVGLRPPEARAS